MGLLSNEQCSGCCGRWGGKKQKLHRFKTHLGPELAFYDTSILPRVCRADAVHRRETERGRGGGMVEEGWRVEGMEGRRDGGTECRARRHLVEMN